MSTTNAIAIVQQDCLASIDRIGQIGSPTVRALRELFVDLWTRCDEASFRAAIVSSRESVTADSNTLQTVRNIENICNVNSVYGKMHRLLNEVQANEDREIDRLRERCAYLAAENTRLRGGEGRRT